MRISFAIITLVGFNFDSTEYGFFQLVIAWRDFQIFVLLFFSTANRSQRQLHLIYLQQSKNQYLNALRLKWMKFNRLYQNPIKSFQIRFVSYLSTSKANVYHTRKSLLIASSWAHSNLRSSHIIFHNKNKNFKKSNIKWAEMFSSWNEGKNLLLVETRSETFFDWTIFYYFVFLFWILIEFKVSLLCQHFLFYVGTRIGANYNNGRKLFSTTTKAIHIFVFRPSHFFSTRAWW